MNTSQPSHDSIRSSPASVREHELDETPLLQADRLIATEIANGSISAAVLLVRRGTQESVRSYGKAAMDTPFLMGSPTKPMTASAVMILRDRGQLQLSDRVVKHLPQFKGDGREAVTIKHLLTHTSGLPDMLPENAELRKSHAPLSEFVDRTCKTPLLFAPGSRVSYQSMGIMLAGVIVERLSGQPLPAFMQANIFGPLKMTRTSLGSGGRALSESAQSQVPEPSDWDWNSSYWRNFGASWGGAQSTAHDMATFIEAFATPVAAPWPQATRLEMRTIQTEGLNEAWGLGWSRQAIFGRTCSAETFGHYGTPGTIVWHDPQTALTCVFLTTKPVMLPREQLLGPVSDLAAQSAQA